MSDRPQHIIGGTDAGALMDYYFPMDGERWHPYRSAFDVYASVIEGVQIEDNLAMALGRAGEAPILSDYCNRHGLDFQHLERNVRFTDSNAPYRSAEVDGVHIAEDLGLDAKLVRSPRQQSAWNDGDAPHHYMCQIAYERRLSGIERMVLVAALNTGPREVEYFEQPDLEAALVECADKFWTDHILKRIPPPPIGASSDSLKAVWPKETLDLKTATETEIEACLRWKDSRAALKTAKEAEAEASARVIGLIGEHAGIAFSDGKPVTYKFQQRKAYTVKATEYRVLRAPSDWSNE